MGNTFHQGMTLQIVDMTFCVAKNLKKNIVRDYFCIVVVTLHTSYTNQPRPQSNFLKNSPGTTWFRGKFLLDLIRQL